MNKISVGIDAYGHNLKEMLKSVRQALKAVEVAIDRREAEGGQFNSGCHSQTVNDNTFMDIEYIKLK